MSKFLEIGDIKRVKPLTKHAYKSHLLAHLLSHDVGINNVSYANQDVQKFRLTSTEKESRLRR